MNLDRVVAWASAAAIGCLVLACSPSVSVVSPLASSDPSLPVSASAGSSNPPPGPGGTPSDASPELRITCDGTATAITEPTVRARPDGIHVRFANPSGQVLEFTVDDATGLAMFGDSVPVAGGDLVFNLGTGVYRLGCGGRPVAFAVVDPDGVYTPTDLGCGNASGTTGTIDYGQDATGPRGSVLDVARMELRGLRPGDLVEQAGYPAADGERLVRVVRNGRVIAILGYSDDGQGGWLIGTTRTCPGSRITVEAP